MVIQGKYTKADIAIAKMASYASALQGGGEGGTFKVMIKAKRALNLSTRSELGRLCRRVGNDFDEKYKSLKMELKQMHKLIGGLPEPSPVFVSPCSMDHRVVRSRVVLNQDIPLSALRKSLEAGRWAVLPNLTSHQWKAMSEGSEICVRNFEINCPISSLPNMREFEVELVKYSNFTTESPSGRATRSVSSQYGVANLLNRKKAVSMVVLGDYAEGELESLIALVSENVLSYVGVTYGWRRTDKRQLHFVPPIEGIRTVDLFKQVQELLPRVGGGFFEPAKFSVVMRQTFEAKCTNAQLENVCEKNGVVNFSPLVCPHCSMLHRAAFCHEHTIPLKSLEVYTAALRRNEQEHRDNALHLEERMAALRKPEDNIGEVRYEGLQEFTNTLPVSRYEFKAHHDVAMQGKNAKENESGKTTDGNENRSENITGGNVNPSGNITGWNVNGSGKTTDGNENRSENIIGGNVNPSGKTTGWNVNGSGSGDRDNENVIMIDVESGDVGASTEGSIPEAKNKNGSVVSKSQERSKVNQRVDGAMVRNKDEFKQSEDVEMGRMGKEQIEANPGSAASEVSRAVASDQQTYSQVNAVKPAAAAAVSTNQPRDTGHWENSIFDEEEYEGASEPGNHSEVLSDNPFHGRAVTEGTPGKIVRVVGPPIQRPLKGTFVGDSKTRRQESSSQRIKSKQDNARNRARSRSRSPSPAEPPNERPEDLELDVSRISERTEGSDRL